MSSLKVRIKVSNQCDNDCWYCLADDRCGEEMSDSISTTIVNKVFDIYNNGEYKRIKFNLTGGDPFISNNIINITNKIRNKFIGIPIYVVGNACTISNIELIKKFRSLGGSVCLSLNEDPLEKIENITKILGKNGVFLFNVLLTNFNMDRIKNIIDVVLQYKLPLRLNYVFDPYDKDNLADKMINIIDYVFLRLEKEGFRYNIFNYPFGMTHPIKQNAIDYCGYGRDYYFFDTYGDVRRCQMEETVSNVLSETLEQDIKVPSFIHDDCKKCDVHFLCKGGCPYTNKFHKYCKIHYAACKHILKMNTRIVNPCLDKGGIYI